MGLLQKFSKTIESYNLLKQNDSVLVALSGGPDSVVLVHLLVKIQSKYKLKISAIYINHHIRPKAAVQEEKFCQKLCDENKIELHLVKEDIPVLSKKSKRE